MNPADPQESLQRAVESIDRVQAELDSRMTDGAEAAAIRAKLDALRGRIRAMLVGLQKQLARAKPGGPLPPTDPALAAKFDALDAQAAAARERFAAFAAKVPALPPPTAAVLLDGHTLGKLLLVELGLVAVRSHAPKAPLRDAEGFFWESTGEWDALGR